MKLKFLALLGLTLLSFNINKSNAQIPQSYGFSQPYSPYSNYGTLGNMGYTGYGSGSTTYGVNSNSTMSNNPWSGTSGGSGVTTPTYMAVQSMHQPNQNVNQNQNSQNNSEDKKTDKKEEKSNKKNPSQNMEENKNIYRIGSTLTGKAYVLNSIALSVNNQPVILDGISSPGPNAKCQEKYGIEWACGLQAESTLRNIVNGKQVTCNLISNGKYPHANCYSEGDNIAELMVSSGFALPSNSSMDKLMQEAKSDHRGFWNDNN